MASKKKTLNQKQLSEVLGITPGMVSKYTKNEQLVRDQSSGLYDLSNQVNKNFLKSRKIAISKIKIPATKPAGRPAAGVQRKQGQPSPVKSPVIDASLTDLRKIKTEKEIEKLDIENTIKREKYISEELAATIFQTYISKIHTGLERGVMAWCEDISGKILEAGELTPAIICKAQDLFFEIIHEAQKGYLRALEKIRKQHGGKI